MDPRKEFIRAAFEPLAIEIATNQVEQLEMKKGLLQPKESYIKQHVDAMMQDLEKGFIKKEEIITKAMELIGEQILLLSPAEKEPIQEELDQLEGKVLTLFSGNLEIQENDTLASVLGFSTSTFAWIYTVAYQFYQSKELEKASIIFSLLTHLNPLVFDYWIALALTQKAQNDDQNAITSFSMASFLNPENPLPHCHLADLYLKQNLTSNASDEITLLEEMISSQNRLDLQPVLMDLKAKASSSYSS